MISSQITIIFYEESGISLKTDESGYSEKIHFKGQPVGVSEGFVHTVYMSLICHTIFKQFAVIWQCHYLKKKKNCKEFCSQT